MIIEFFGPSSLIGTQTIYSNPVDVRDAKEVSLRLRVTGVIGTSPTLDVTVEHSNTGEGDWTTLGTYTQAGSATSEDKSYTVETDKMMRFIRGKYVVGGTSPGFTFSHLGRGN